VGSLAFALSDWGMIFGIILIIAGAYSAAVGGNPENVSARPSSSSQRYGGGGIVSNGPPATSYVGQLASDGGPSRTMR